MKSVLCFFCIVSFNCISQSSATTLDTNSVAAKLNANGVIFHDNLAVSSGYEIPKNTGKHVIFSSGFWIGATDMLGNLHLAAVRYSQNGADFFPGPYSSNNSYNAPLFLQKYNQPIWTVSSEQVNYHLANYLTPGYVPVPSIANWPGNGDVNLGVAANLAPFIDVNADNTYSPLDGDYPDIRGDLASYIILNDSKGIHTASGGDPLLIELHIMAYQYRSNDYLDSTTFLNVRVFNRGNQQFDTLKFGFFTDGDIGNYDDDYFGSVPSKDMMYFYNGDNNDENSGYGLNPPALGIVSLAQPMVACGYLNYASSFPYNDPQTPLQYWNFMNAKWANGTPWTSGGLGFASSTGGSNVPTNFMFDGNPTAGTGWTELTNNNSSGDRRGIMVIESNSLFPNETSCYDLAIIFARSGGNNLQNVQALVVTSDSVKQFYQSQVEFNCSQMIVNIDDLSENEVLISPNPSNGKITIKYLNEKLLSIYDINGKLVQHVRLDSPESTCEITLNPGVYIFKIGSNASQMNKRVVITD